MGLEWWGAMYLASFSGLTASVLTFFIVLGLYIFQSGASTLKDFKNVSAFNASTLNSLISVYRSLRYFLK